MRLQSPWIPRLADTDATTAERLVHALTDDIIEGRLSGGERLPAHRDLAWKLNIGLGTVTKAYIALERRGLTRSIKGRGTFVATRQVHNQPQIDLSANTPPAMLSARLLAQTLTVIARKIDTDHLNLYAPATGHPEHRRVMARWLETLGLTIDPSQLVLTNSARQALALAFELNTCSQSVILTERITYPGAIALAARRGYRMQGIAMDAEGMVPEALAEAFNQLAATDGGVLYLTPTLHNPTTAIMSHNRRLAIINICRRANARIIEDGVYASAEHIVPPLAALAPDITYHVNSLSKSLGPGLQIGMLTLPSAQDRTVDALLQDMPLAPSPLSCAVVEEWLINGAIHSIRRDMRHEAQRRTQLAVSLLSDEGLVVHPEAYNVWLPMPREQASQLVENAAAAGIKLTKPETVMVNQDDPMSGIRLCLGGPSFEDLTKALTCLAVLRHQTTEFQKQC